MIEMKTIRVETCDGCERRVERDQGGGEETLAFEPFVSSQFSFSSYGGRIIDVSLCRSGEVKGIHLCAKCQTSLADDMSYWFGSERSAERKEG